MADGVDVCGRGRGARDLFAKEVLVGIRCRPGGACVKGQDGKEEGCAVETNSLGFVGGLSEIRVEGCGMVRG